MMAGSDPPSRNGVTYLVAFTVLNCYLIVPICLACLESQKTGARGKADASPQLKHIGH
jgi:hypothetical protein